MGTIARQLHVHRDTVRRVLAQAGEPAAASPLRPSRVDPYRAFILQTLAKFPTLSAAWLFVMVHERGYRGSAEHFRHVIAGMRPRPLCEAFLRLRTLPGEQAQIDGGQFGHLQIGRARRPLMAFVMVLSYSRRISLRFSLDARLDSFLSGHVRSFVAFGGVLRVVLYDFVAGNKIVLLCRSPLCAPTRREEQRGASAADLRLPGQRGLSWAAYGRLLERLPLPKPSRKSRLREGRTYGSVRAKAAWLSYSAFAGLPGGTP